jgi:hypothetical protein
VNVSTPKNTAVLITLSGSDANGQSLTFTIGSQPANGYVGTITAVGGSSATVIYAPSPGLNGVDTFTFAVNDGYDDSVAATVIVDVGESAGLPPSSPKVWSHSTISTHPGTPVTTTLQAWDAELDGLNWIVVDALGGSAQFIPSPSTTSSVYGYSTNDVVFTPNTGFSGTGHIIFYVDDGNNPSSYYNVASVNIVVDGGNGQTPTIVSAPALSLPGIATLFLGMLGLVLVFLIRNRNRSQT